MKSVVRVWSFDAAGRCLHRKSERLLKEADWGVAQGMHEAAGRSAYFAIYHVAQALIFERAGIVAKTHSGVHSEFHGLTKTDPNFDADLRKLLSQSYNLKRIADYETGAGSIISAERAVQAVGDAHRFAEYFRHLLS